MDINNPQTYKRALREGNKSMLHKEYKGIKWAEEELKKIEEINDSKERVEKVKKIWWICDRVYYLIHNVPEGVDPNEPYGFNHFKKIYDRLKYLKNKPIKPIKINKNNQSQSDKESEILCSKISENEDNNQLEYISCQQCFKEIKTGEDYWYHKTKNDNHKFCSTKCYDNHYGEYCNKCASKFLTTYREGNNNYCSTCYEKVKQEEKEEEEKSTRYCKYCSTKLVKEGNLKYSLRICDKDDCFLKLDKELYPDKYSQSDNNNNYNDNSINNNNHIRERERERERESKFSLNNNNYSPKSPN